MSSKTIKDLPLYPTSSGNDKALWVTIEQDPGQLRHFVSTMRKTGCQFMQQFKHQKDDSLQFIETSKASLNKNLEYIRSETNIIPKVVFISLSGLSGLLIGFRRSTLHKIFYSNVLAVGAAALCFPKEAKLYSNQLYQLGKGYVMPAIETKKTKVSKVSQEPKDVDQTLGKDRIVKFDNESIKSSKSSKTVVEDKGQSNDADKDMYTTRSK